MKKFSEEREKLRKELSEQYKNPKKEFIDKLQRFDKNWNKAEEIVAQIYNDLKTNKEKVEIVKQYVREFYSYEASIVRYFRVYKDKSIKENLSKAEKSRTKHRFDEFMKFHKKEKYEFNGKTRTLGGWLNAYMSGEIDDKTFFEIISGWEHQNPDYDFANYSKSNRASRDSTINDLTD